MAFDAIMGVGRSPKITEDLQINPFGLINKIISSNFIISTNYSAAASTTGNEKLIIADEYDSNIAPAFVLTHTHSSINTTFTSYLTFDLGKVAFIESMLSKVVITKSGTIFSNSANMQHSQDGITWIDLSPALSLGTRNIILTYSKIRFIRYKLESDNIGGTAGATLTWSISFMRTIVDNLQY